MYSKQNAKELRMHGNLNEMLLAFLKNYKTNLELRHLIIEAVGRVGQADEIRAAMAKKHKANIARLDDIIDRWGLTSEETKIATYLRASKQIDSKLLSELKTLKFLVTKKEDNSGTNTSTVVLDRGIYVHIALVHNTLGLLASIDLINNNLNHDLLKDESANDGLEQSEELSQLKDWFQSRPKAQAVSTIRPRNKAMI